MVSRALLAALALAGLAGFAHAGTVTFDSNNGVSLSHGSFLYDGGFDFGMGLTGTITTIGGVNAARIYSAAYSGGRDEDLEAPTNVAGGWTYSGGNVLIVAENLSADPAMADDNAGGGTITLAFDRMISFSGATLLDAEAGGNEISVFLDGTRVIGPAVTGDDMFGLYDIAPVSGKELQIVFGGSGAIDSLMISVVPAPAGALLLLSGLGALAARRRRRS